MTYEKSCGAVVFAKTGGQIKYLLVANLSGIYGFPKGHTEGAETEEQTALREVFEETGLHIRLIPGFRASDSHPIPGKKDTVKQITYFLGAAEYQAVAYPKEELSGAFWVSYPEAMELFQFESSKRILKEANTFLTGLSKTADSF